MRIPLQNLPIARLTRARSTLSNVTLAQRVHELLASLVWISEAQMRETPSFRIIFAIDVCSWRSVIGDLNRESCKENVMFRSFVCLFIVWTITLLGGSEARSQETATPSELGGIERYTFRKDHDPNGIGKFYMGREIAHVMGHQGIDWLERDTREAEEGLSQLIECLKIKPGMSVADIGAGSGVISVLLSKKVGTEGVVLAVDIQQEMLDALQHKCKLLEITNVESVLGTTKSPRLEAGTVDLVIMVDVYHEFDFPYEMLSEIAKSLKQGGRVAFVEYRKEDPRVPIKEVHKMSEAQVKKEALVEGHGLKWVETYRKLPRQHVIFFEKE